jgi:hypothetical protein
MVLVNRCTRCDKPLVQSGWGRPRLYCDGACRVAALRRRRRTAQAQAERLRIDPVAYPEPPADWTAPPAPDADEAVVKAVMSGLHLVADLNYCGRVARPKLAWLCEQAAQEIGAVLRRHFGTET